VWFFVAARAARRLCAAKAHYRAARGRDISSARSVWNIARIRNKSVCMRGLGGSGLVIAPRHG